MLTIFIRTIIVYIILIGIMRLLGKRQLGELEISELITTILLSEIASLPITNQNVPLMHAVVPLLTIMAIEIITSALLVKFPNLKGVLSTRASVLVRNGKIDQRQLKKNRISCEELISELRLNNITDISEVEYAILEQNGLLSVIPKSAQKTPTAEQLNIETKENGIMHIIISRGKWNKFNLKILKIAKEDALEYLKRKRVNLKDVFLLLIDDSGKFKLIKEEK